MAEQEVSPNTVVASSPSVPQPAVPQVPASASVPDGGVWECESCGKVWTGKTARPVRCPDCRSLKIHRKGGEPVSVAVKQSEQQGDGILAGIGQQGGSIDDVEYVAPASNQPRSNFTPPAPKTRREYAEGLDPTSQEEQDFQDMIANLMGDKRRAIVIRQTFFRGDSDSANYMNYVMLLSNMDKNKRRMAIIRWFGRDASELGVNIDARVEDYLSMYGGDMLDNMRDPLINKSGQKRQMGQADPIDDMLRAFDNEEAQQFKRDMLELKRIQMQQRMEKARQGADITGTGQVNEPVKVPAVDEDGNPMFEGGKPIMMEISKQEQPAYLQSLAMLKRNSKMSVVDVERERQRREDEERRRREDTEKQERARKEEFEREERRRIEDRLRDEENKREAERREEDRRREDQRREEERKREDERRHYDELQSQREERERLDRERRETERQQLQQQQQTLMMQMQQEAQKMQMQYMQTMMELQKGQHGVSEAERLKMESKAEEERRRREDETKRAYEEREQQRKENDARLESIRREQEDRNKMLMEEMRATRDSMTKMQMEQLARVIQNQQEALKSNTLANQIEQIRQTTTMAQTLGIGGLKTPEAQKAELASTIQSRMVNQMDEGMKEARVVGKELLEHIKKDSLNRTAKPSTTLGDGDKAKFFTAIQEKMSPSQSQQPSYQPPQYASVLPRPTFTPPVTSERSQTEARRELGKMMAQGALEGQGLQSEQPTQQQIVFPEPKMNPSIIVNTPPNSMAMNRRESDSVPRENEPVEVMSSQQQISLLNEKPAVEGVTPIKPMAERKKQGISSMNLGE